MPKKHTEDYEFQLPFGPPPVLPDVEKQLKEYLLCPENLPIHDYKKAQKYWPREPNPASLYHFDFAPLGTMLKVDRDPTTGKLLQFREVPIDDIGQTAKNSMSLQRAPGPPDEAVRGSSTNYPFWPGGFPELLQDKNAGEDVEIDFVNNLLTIPPGFERGIKFKADGRTPLKESEEQEPPSSDGESLAPEIIPEEKVETTVVNLMSLIKQEEDLLGLWKEETKEDVKKHIGKISLQDLEVDIDADAAEIVPKEDIIPVLNITQSAPFKRRTRLEWAEELDVSNPVRDFAKKVPVMAKTWDFELDTFQKKAILKLEDHCNVFVAAHTSAGKTVVAEYAIALSKRHMTKSIYTSPIKALSNQKYREFKVTFEDVGIITGDFQINQTAQCLIMTTEILRSMLYYGSEVIRELEYVIFDEVHYINDSERGHVWEEVLILLPDHVSIVMLSATVPNALEFADWVGQTKQKKMYVVSTLKRPVPLQHYLYTGSGGKSKHEQFLVVNEEGDFLQKGYNDAVKAIEARQNTKKGYGPREGKVYLTQKQEATIWVGLVNHLEQQDRLPVVAFTLSRNRCDQNSSSLTTVDLTTKSEKNFIQKFFKRSIQNLKQDRDLPQVVKLKQLLERGIGVHHSGILPILKEIVEMLFQKGLVKLLFATETFAMGVNMPARTVVFDSIEKFDGSGMRTLLPAEYIQMAGRAGRRGLDKTGTVLIMCKDCVPNKSTLNNMMLGKPTALESKFRLTYSMILNLFRVEKIEVEKMMSHSFKERVRSHKQKIYKKELESVEKKIEEISLNTQQHGTHWEPLSRFYDIAAEFLQLRSDVIERVFTQSKCLKELTPGRILLVSHKEHVNKLGILLTVDTSKMARVFKVLVLCSDQKAETNGFGDEIDLSVASGKEKSEKQNERDALWYKMLGLASKKKIFVPDGVGGHTVVTLSASDIVEILKEKVSIDTNLVLQDWEKRQIPRFRDDPPGQTCSQAIRKLTEFTQNVSSDSVPLEYVSQTKYLPSRNIDELQNLIKVGILEQKINDCTDTDIANFEQLFEEVFKYKWLEEEKARLQHMNSYKSLSLYPDFQDRVAILRRLNYIDSDNKVQLRGRVACEMGSRELMTTGMVLHGVLADKQPSEIAALLSCLVFQQRTKAKLQLTERLKQGMSQIKKIANCLGDMEKEYALYSEEHEPNFGLVQVVYEWAQGKPFREIMELTDVQEGIIVRCIQQLNETLCDVKNAAHLIGNPVLKQKMQEASEAIKRDIVFAASLYTSEDNSKLNQILEDTKDERLLPVGDE